jgi:hypothetical protein
MQRILIYHTSGTRSNQVDEFQAEGFREILVGRDESSTVRFDPDREDLVSRNHLKIYADPANANCFLITDLQSRNGSFLNRQRIGAPTRIHHGDLVQLGPGGPEFRMEFDPPPASAARPTRMLSPSEGGAYASSLAKQTRMSGIPDVSTPRPIGRATVERMLDDTFGRVKKESGKTLWVGIAAIIMIAAVGIGTYFYLRNATVESAKRSQEQQLLLLQMAQVVKQQPSDDAAVRSQMDKLSGDMKKIISENQALRQSVASGASASTNQADQGQQDSSSDYNAGLAKASQLYKANDFEKAYAECVRISQLNPSSWGSYYVAGLSAEAMNQPQVALEAYQSALSLAPDDSTKAQITKMINSMQSVAGG